MGGTGMAQQTDIEIVAQHTAAMRAELDELLAEHGNLSAQEFHELTERDCWCNARRALELGPGGRGDCAQQEGALAGRMPYKYVVQGEQVRKFTARKRLNMNRIWDVDGIEWEDLPTVSDLLCAADTKILAREVALRYGGKPDGRGRGR